VRAEIERVPHVRFDRCHLRSFGESALSFETVYYVLSSQYVDAMDARQAVNLGILRSFEAHGIRLAYPTQTVYVHSAAALEDKKTDE